MTTLNPELQFAVSSTLQERLAELDEQITASESGQEPWVARASEAPDAGDRFARAYRTGASHPWTPRVGHE